MDPKPAVLVCAILSGAILLLAAANTTAGHPLAQQQQQQADSEQRRLEIGDSVARSAGESQLLDGDYQLSRQLTPARPRHLVATTGANYNNDNNKLPNSLLANLHERIRRQAYQQQQQTPRQLAQLQQAALVLPATAGSLEPNNNSNNNNRRPFPLSLTNQQLFEDEQTMRSQLPDLIAQAHQDKNVERALLKMLINASLRSALSNMAASQPQLTGSGASFAGLTGNSGSGNGNNWLLASQPGDSDGTGNDSIIRLARLDQQQQQLGVGGPSDSASLDPLVDSLGLVGQSMAAAAAAAAAGANNQDQYQTGSMDKREYIKPCSFNAVSCVRTPFRRI